MSLAEIGLWAIVFLLFSVIGLKKRNKTKRQTKWPEIQRLTTGSPEIDQEIRGVIEKARSQNG